MNFQLHSWPRAILHLDADAFFASCEQAIHPEYRGKPVVTGKERGIVAAASYEAKAKGVSRGVPLWEVKKICPDAIILPSDYETYSLFSKRMFAIMRRFTSMVEEYSIDEAFAEITGLQRPLRGSYETIARRIKETVERELGITVSVGLSLSKVLAKIGSKYRKPSGFVAIPGREIETILKDLPLEKVWGIGPKTTAYARTLDIKTALDFAYKNESFIKKHFTKPHQDIWRELKGECVYEVVTGEKTGYASISKFKTFSAPSEDRTAIFGQLVRNLEGACAKARRFNLAAQRVIVCLRTQDFHERGMELVLSRATAYPQEMMDLVKKGFADLFRPGMYRTSGVVLADLIPCDALQPTLFEPPLQLTKWQRVYRAVDDLNAKLGRHSVHLAASAKARLLSVKRGGIPERQLTRLKGETRYQHLSIPMLLGKAG